MLLVFFDFIDLAARFNSPIGATGCYLVASLAFRGKNVVELIRVFSYKLLLHHPILIHLSSVQLVFDVLVISIFLVLHGIWILLSWLLRLLRMRYLNIVRLLCALS